VVVAVVCDPKLRVIRRPSRLPRCCHDRARNPGRLAHERNQLNMKSD
jgi:hypothetical protein